MKAIRKVTLLLVIASFIAILGCEKNNNEMNNIMQISELPTNPAWKSLPLQGTFWKLIGFANVDDNSIKIAEPQNDFSYELILRQDSVFEGTSSTNEIKGDYILDTEYKTINITKYGGTKKGEILDGYHYSVCFQAIESYCISKNGLALYYDNKKHYLLYRPI